MTVTVEPAGEEADEKQTGGYDPFVLVMCGLTLTMILWVTGVSLGLDTTDPLGLLGSESGQ